MFIRSVKSEMFFFMLFYGVSTKNLKNLKKNSFSNKARLKMIDKKDVELRKYS